MALASASWVFAFEKHFVLTAPAAVVQTVIAGLLAVALLLARRLRGRLDSAPNSVPTWDSEGNRGHHPPTAADWPRLLDAMVIGWGYPRSASRLGSRR